MKRERCSLSAFTRPRRTNLKACWSTLSRMPLRSPQRQPPPPWLSEGFATFMESLWIEKHQGRDRAAGHAGGRPVRTCTGGALPVPATAPGSRSKPPSLRSTTAPRRPMFFGCCGIWWAMPHFRRRSGHMIQPPNPARTHGADPLRICSNRLASTHDLSWFFEDWVNADKGLPDLSIVSVFPNAAQQGTFLVAVNVANAGYATAEVPVTVRTAKAP